MKLNKTLKTDMLGSVGYASSLAGGELRLFSGTQPADADSAETGTLLAIATPVGKAMEFLAVDGSVKSVDIWEYTTLATGTIGWARLCLGGDSGEAAVASPRHDVAVSRSGSELNIPNNTITTVGQIGHISRFEFKLL